MKRYSTRCFLRYNLIRVFMQCANSEQNHWKRRNFDFVMCYKFAATSVICSKSVIYRDLRRKCFKNDVFFILENTRLADEKKITRRSNLLYFNSSLKTMLKCSCAHTTPSQRRTYGLCSFHCTINLSFSFTVRKLHICATIFAKQNTYSHVAPFRWCPFANED